MKKYLLLCAFFLCIGSNVSHAKGIVGTNNDHVDTNLKMGLGYDVDLNGITLRIGKADAIRFDISIGLGLTANTGNNGQTNFDLSPGFRVLFPIIIYKALVVQGVLGTQAKFNINNSPTVDLAFFGGIMPEIFILPRLSIEILFGLALNLNNLTGDAQIALGTIGEGISIVSGAAFHWYF